MILVTGAEGNLASRWVIEANGGALDQIVDGEALSWLATSEQGAWAEQQVTVRLAGEPG